MEVSDTYRVRDRTILTRGKCREDRIETPGEARVWASLGYSVY